MVEKTFEVTNQSGLHLRPIQLIIKAATNYSSELIIEKEGQQVNGKSMMHIMTLAAEQGTLLKFIASGDDEAELLTEIEKLFLSNFSE